MLQAVSDSVDSSHDVMSSKSSSKVSGLFHHCVYMIHTEKWQSILLFWKTKTSYSSNKDLDIYCVKWDFSEALKQYRPDVRIPLPLIKWVSVKIEPESAGWQSVAWTTKAALLFWKNK